MWLTLTLLQITFQCSSFKASSHEPSCGLTCSNQEGVYKMGDVMFGAILPRSMFNLQYSMDYTRFADPWRCSSPHPPFLRHLMALIFATEEINKSSELLPNITLGYQVYDSCSSVMKALHGTFSIFSNRKEIVPNYSCQMQDPPVGIIGDLSSVTSYSISQLLGIYKFPQDHHPDVKSSSPLKILQTQLQLLQKPSVERHLLLFWIMRGNSLVHLVYLPRMQG